MKITERTHNIQTGEIEDIERDETSSEAALRIESQKKIAAEQAAEAEKETAKAALLKRLGITADEAALLLG
jgi:hypothetical protein